jgi:hypothetical protein
MNDAYNKTIAHSDDLRDINTPHGWFGDSASAAANAVNKIIDGLEEHAAEIAAGRRSVGDVGDAITGVVSGVLEADGIAAEHHFTISDDGAINDISPPPDAPDDQKLAVAQERQRVRSSGIGWKKSSGRQPTSMTTSASCSTASCPVTPSTRRPTATRALRWRLPVTQETRSDRYRSCHHHP